MKTSAALVIKYRFAIILITLGLSIFFAYGMSKVTINSDMLSYLKPDDPVMQLFNRIGEDYGGNSLALVAIETHDIFTTETLTLISQLTEAYSQIPGVATVMSLTNILDIAKTENGLEIRKLINKYAIPQTSDELLRLKTYTLNKEMYVGKFISVDGKITLLLCRLGPDAKKDAVAARIKTLSETHKGAHTVYYSGLPAQMLEINEFIIEDLCLLIPIVILIVLATLYFSFRNLRGVALPLLTVIIAAVWAVGLMGWLNVEMSAISNIMPVILIAVGTAYGIHVVAKYHEDIHPGAEKQTTIVEALSEVGVPILLAGLTTMIGFLSFIGSYLTAVTDFGLFSAFGIGVAMLIAVLLIPAILMLLRTPTAAAHAMHQETHFLIGVMDRLGAMVLQHEKFILIAAAALILLAATGIPRITTESNLIQFYPPDSDMWTADELMRERFGGSTPIQMLIDGDLKDPVVLREMLRLGKYMESLSDVNNTQSLADLVCEMNDVMNGHYTIPDTKEQVANLLFMLEGEEMLDQLVNKDYSEGIIQARFASYSTHRITATINAIETYLATEMDTRLRVVSVADLNSTEREQLRDFQIGRISTAILYDARDRLPAGQFDQEQLITQLRQLAAVEFSPLTEAAQTSLRARVDLFFWEEADVILDDDELIADVTAAVVDLTAAQPVSEHNLTALLEAVIPPDYWEDDPEVISYTVEFLLPILREKQNFSRVDAIVTALLPLFSSELQANPKFHADLRDDVWGLNEQVVGVPVALKIGQGGAEVALSATQSGMLLVLQKINDSLIGSQLRSLAWALGLVAVLMSLQFKSVKIGLVVTAPILLTVLINFGVMGYAHVPLDIASVMIAGVAIGVGIDYAIHFSSRLKAELTIQPDELFAVDKTLETTGRAIIINALTVALGFIVLLWSNIVPIRRFGWMLSMTMGVSALSALTFLPALTLVLKRFLFQRRQYPRFSAPLVYRSALADSQPQPVINVSLGGLRIYHNELLTVGQRSDVELLFQQELLLTGSIRVVWQRPLPEGAAAKFEVGLRFVNVSDEQLNTLAEVLKEYGEIV